MTIKKTTKMTTKTPPPEVDYDKLVQPLSQDLAHFNPCTNALYYKNHLNYTTDPNNIKCYAGDDLYFADRTCEIGLNSQGQSPVIANQLTNPPPADYKGWPNYRPIQCIYDRNKIDTIDQSLTAVKQFGADNSLTKAFCGSKTFTCPIDMVGGCSRYFSNEKDGDYCRDLYNNMTPTEKDSVIMNYCTRNQTDDCKCANRSTNPEYQKLKQGNPFSDACWYIPCSNDQQFFTPSEFSGNPDCPSNICQIVYNISQAHDVDIDHIKNDINCDFSGGKYIPKPPPIIWVYFAGMILTVILLFVYAGKK
jgi:hypothetical protein